MEEKTLKVQVSSKGPLLIKGGAVIVHEDGTEEARTGSVALCRCGLSAKKPFCDGAHRNCTTL
ncbi:MAG: CDGSH iron-sulfur domain-containing protein [bacterium]|jgi:CDGSH-type Zn-finger protein